MKYLDKSDLREERFILAYSSERVQSTMVGEDAAAARESMVGETTEEEKMNGFSRMAPLLPIHSSFHAPSFKVHFTTRGFPFHTLLKLS